MHIHIFVNIYSKITFVYLEKKVFLKNITQKNYYKTLPITINQREQKKLAEFISNDRHNNHRVNLIQNVFISKLQSQFTSKQF